MRHFLGGVPTVAAGGGGGFVPTDIAGCTLWLDASDTATITHSSGAVSLWEDKSANGFDVAQGGGSNKPITGSRTQNGLNVLDFDGANHVLVRAGTVVNNASNGAWTAFMVALPDVVTGTATPLISDNFGAQTAQFIRRDGTAFECVGFTSGGAFTIDGAGVTLSASPPYLWRTRCTGTAIEAFVDGTSNGATAVTNQRADSGNLAVGAHVLSGTSPVDGQFDGWIAEIVVYDVALGAGDVADVETYLSTKWGL